MFFVSLLISMMPNNSRSNTLTRPERPFVFPPAQQNCLLLYSFSFIISFCLLFSSSSFSLSILVVCLLSYSLFIFFSCRSSFSYRLSLIVLLFCTLRSYAMIFPFPNYSSAVPFFLLPRYFSLLILPPSHLCDAWARFSLFPAHSFLPSSAAALKNEAAFGRTTGREKWRHRVYWNHSEWGQERGRQIGVEIGRL